MKHSLTTRVKTAALAAMMVLASIPVSALHTVKAEAAVNPQIRFTNHIAAGDATTANVVTGQRVTIRETTRVDGSFSRKLILRSSNFSTSIESSPDGSAGETTNKDVTISAPDAVTGERTIFFQDTFDLTDDGEGNSELNGSNGLKAKELPYSDQYSVRALYATLTKEGQAMEVSGVGTHPSGSSTGTNNVFDQLQTEITSPTGTARSTVITASAARNLDIMDDSQIMLRCTKAEGPSGTETPSFSIVGKTGYFDTVYDATYVGSVTEEGATYTSTKESGFTADKQPTKTLVLRLRKSDGTQDYIILNPVGTTATGERDGDEKALYHNYVQQNTYFVVTYNPIYSDPIILNVMTPQFVINELESDIASFESESTYFNLNAGEALDFLESNFKVAYGVTKYEAPFKVVWTWVPTYHMEDGEFKELKYNSKDDDERAPYYSLLSLPTVDENTREYWGDARISTADRIKEDVRGYLVGTVYYQDGGSANYMPSLNVRAVVDANTGKITSVNEKVPDYRSKSLSELQDLSKLIPIKDIIIRGTGEPPSLSIVEESRAVLKDGEDPLSGKPGFEIVAGSEGGWVVDGGAEVPLKPGWGSEEQLEMDAYRGGIDDVIYPPTYAVRNGTHPFSYTLKMLMGQKNGASPYARVQVSGDTEAFTYIINGKDYAPVQPGSMTFDITNADYQTGGKNLTQGQGTLTITLQEFGQDVRFRGAINITISFFKRNAAGEDTVNSDAVYYIHIQPYDSTPKRDSRLSSLVITDQAGRTIGPENGFTFDPEVRGDRDEYVITMPFRSNAIRITPTMNDPLALLPPNNRIRMIMTDFSNKPVKLQDYITGPAANPAEEEVLEDENENRNGYYYKLNNGATGNNFFIPFYNVNTGSPTDVDDPMVGQPYTITIRTPTQDPRIKYWTPPYILKVTRAAPSTVKTLSSLSVYLDGDEENNLIVDFIEGQTTYNITVPYSTQKIKVNAEVTDPQSELSEMVIRDEHKNVVAGLGLETYGPGYRTKEWLKNVKKLFTQDDPVVAVDDELTLEYWVTSELGAVYREKEEGDDKNAQPSIDPESKYTNVRAEQEVYKIKITREPPNRDSLLADLVVMDKDEKVLPITPSFNPSTKVFTVDIPYSVRQVRFQLTPEDPNVDRIELWQGSINGNTGEPPAEEPEEPPEDSDSTSPSSSSSSSGFDDSNHKDDTGPPPEDTAAGQRVSYRGSRSGGGSFTTLQTMSTMSYLTASGIGGSGNGMEDKRLLWYENGNDDSTMKLELPTAAFDVVDKTDSYARSHEGNHPFIFKVWAEDVEAPTTEYRVRVIRDEPSHDAALTDLQIKDELNVNLSDFVFHTDMFGCEDGNSTGNHDEGGRDTYHITVPYTTRQVSFIATARHQYATIEIREEDTSITGRISRLLAQFFPYTVESGANSRLFNLKDGTGRDNEKEFHIVVTAEDETTTRTYCIKISREPPSDDARLKGLVAQNTTDFKPLFISKTTAYTATLNEGAPGTIIIATANHPGATIRVEGAVVQSGSPSDLIELIDITQTIHIEVIAEDGVTRMIYTITITNPNLIEKTSNADLRDLKVNYGLMTPEFQAAVLDYEVTTKETAWSVDIIPRLADPMATMKVFSGTRELGDYNGNYAMAIVDGQNNVSVEVTSPDGTVTKTYAVAIFRNDEEKLKNLKPLEAEDIDFEHVSNPIIVKIEEYPRVGASVFNTLREEYPDYSIVFQGNDYSIRFDAKNLTRVIPQTEIYDFQMTYASPDEDAIYDLIAEYDYNDDIINDVVMPYFDYHGSLPGPATFSLSLGRHYANDLLYWHYYNRERERIDYYGALESNGQGNIAVSIDHFSTYVVAPEHRIAGSEDKDGVIDELGMVSNGQDLLGSGGKINPDTGAASAPAPADEPGAVPSLVRRPDVYTRKKEDP